MTSLSGAASGAFIGGWFIDHSYWQNVFGLYAGLAVVAGLIVGAFLEAPPGNPRLREDWLGVAFAFVAFFAYNYVTAYGERRDWLWDPWIDFWIVTGLSGFVAFLAWETHLGERAFIRLRLFKIRNLALGSALGFSLGAPLFGANQFLLYAQSVLGYPPSTAGALLLLRIVAIAIVAPTAVLLVNANKVDVKVPVVLGFVLVPLSYGLLAVATTFESNVFTFVIALVHVGRGFRLPLLTDRERDDPLAPAGLRPSKALPSSKWCCCSAASIAGLRARRALRTTTAGAYLSILAGQSTLHHLSQIGAHAPPAAFGGLVSAQGRRAGIRR